MGIVTYPLILSFSGSHVDEHLASLTPKIEEQGLLIDGHGVPVCEITPVLMALQRMVYRSYLATFGDRKTLLSLSHNERLFLSLYLAKTGKPPISFYLDWFSKGVLPELPESMLTEILSRLYDALRLYETKTLKTTAVTRVEFLALAVFNDFWEIVSRIGKVGNIQAIQLRILDFDPVSLDDTGLAYAASLKGKPSYLRSRILTGMVVAPRTMNRDFALVQTKTHRVKVFAEDEKANYKFINSLLNILALYPDPFSQPIFTFRGRPRLWIGDDPTSFPEFILQPAKYLGTTKGEKRPVIFSYKLPRDRQIFQVEEPNETEAILA